MSDSSKINNSGHLGPLAKGSNAKSKPSEAPLEKQDSNLERKQTVIKANQVYSKPSETIRAQADLPSLAGHDLPELAATEQTPTKPEKRALIKSDDNPSKSNDLKIDQQVLARNPVLAAQLQNRKSKESYNTDKPKKSPPKYDPRLSFGNKEIPARFNRLQLPGRLKGISDDKVDTLDKLRDALESKLPDHDPRLISHYAKKLIANSSASKYNSPSLADLLSFDLNIANYSALEVRSFLEEVLANTELDPEQQEHLSQVIARLGSGDSELLRALVMLFLPLPLPYDLLDIDEEFELDERELRRDSNEDDSDEEAKDDEETKEPHSLPALSLPATTDSGEVLMSIRSFNYGKMQFLLSYDAGLDSIKLNIKSDHNFDEIGLALELALEDAASLDTDKYSSSIYPWDSKVLHLAETRDLKLKHNGSLSPLLLRVTNALLETVFKNDSGDTVDASYKLL